MSIEVANESGVDVDVQRLERLARFVLDDLRVNPLVELSIRLVDLEAMSSLHEHFMNEPGPTDVPAFPMDELRPGREGEEPEEGVLGDIVLCPSVAAKQAAEAGHATEEELLLLTTHGILHLLGYDHGDATEEREMFSEQSRLLSGWMKRDRR